MTKQEVEPRSYAKDVKGPSKEEDMKNQEEDYRENTPPRIFKGQYQQNPSIEIPQEEGGFRRETPFRRSSSPTYQTIFIGSCYSCYNFGHNAINCRANTKNISNDEGHTRNNYPRISHEAKNRGYNKSGSLSDEVE
jgi:hypothetical protein